MKVEKQTVGEILKQARTEKGLTLDEISRDTNVPKKYLEAIEEDNFSVFAGETYVIGFISTYAEALEIDRDFIIAQYRRQKKIEESSPIEVLVGKNKKSYETFLQFFIAGGILILVIIGFVVLRGHLLKESKPRTFTFSIDESKKIYETKFRVGDTLNLTGKNNTIQIVFFSLEKGNILTLKVGNNPYSIKGSGILTLDSNYDGTNDINIEVLSAKRNNIRISISEITPVELAGNAELEEINKNADSILSEKVWYTGELKKEILMKVFSTAPSWIAYIPDKKNEKNVFLKENSQEIILFSTLLTLYYGNSGAIRINIEGKEDSLGDWGEVGKSVFYWKRKGKDYLLVEAKLK